MKLSQASSPPPFTTFGPARRDPPWLVLLLIAITFGLCGLVLVAPLITVFIEALRKGVDLVLKAAAEPDALSAMRLTLLVCAVAVPLNTIFGVAAAWAVTKFTFPGRVLLTALIDLPFSISPVVSGLMLVLLYGAHGWFGPVLQALGIEVIFAFAGLVMATTLVTLPFVARQLIPIMQAQGLDEEQAAATLGAGPWRTFFLVTLPNIKWALMHGVLLCTARAMGEFGAVSVVSGHIRGQTATMPLQVEILYNEYNSVAAFSLAAILAMFALVTLAVKHLLELRHNAELAALKRR
jgi:sulfate transport system permease protein